MTEPMPMSREEIIEYVKEHGMLNDSWHDFHTNFEAPPETILGYHVMNESNARCYVAIISGHIIVFIEDKL